MKSLFLVAMIAIFNSGRAEAGCGSYLIEEVVRGKTYSASNESKFATKLTLSPEGYASYGSALDGHPGGFFTWNGLCSGNEVIVSFHPTLAAGSVRTALHLQCIAENCRVLSDKISGRQFIVEE